MAYKNRNRTHKGQFIDLIYTIPKGTPEPRRSQLILLNALNQNAPRGSKSFRFSTTQFWKFDEFKAIGSMSKVAEELMELKYLEAFKKVGEKTFIPSQTFTACQEDTPQIGEIFEFTKGCNWATGMQAVKKEAMPIIPDFTLDGVNMPLFFVEWNSMKLNGKGRGLYSPKREFLQTMIRAGERGMTDSEIMVFTNKTIRTHGSARRIARDFISDTKKDWGLRGIKDFEFFEPIEIQTEDGKESGYRFKFPFQETMLSGSGLRE